MIISPVDTSRKLVVGLIALMAFVCLIFSAQTSYGQLTVSCVPQAVTCNGGSNGEIEVTVTGGNGVYQFSLDNATWEPAVHTASPYVISGLAAGSYDVYVRDDGSETGEQLGVVVSEPTALSFTTGGQDWSCVSCTGTITLSVAGGTAPYDTTITLGGSEIPQPYTSLCAGVYTVTVVDANLCPATPQPSVDITIALDNQPPVGCTFPTDRLINAGYNAVGRFDTVNFITPATSVTYNGTQAHPYDNDTLIYYFDASLYNNLQLKIAARQDNVEQYQNTDFLKVSYTFDGGGSWVDVMTDFCRWQANDDTESGPCTGEINLTENATWIDLPNGAGESGFGVRVVCYSESASRSYTIERLRVRRNSTTAAVTLALSGQPVGCTDNYSAVNITSVDSLLHWYCNTTGNLEFEFKRVWYVADQCGNRVRHEQNISVGQNPSLTEPTDTIIDFCYYLDVNIASPICADNCMLADTSWTIAGVGSGSGNIIDRDFPQPLAPISYTINWMVTDSAGFSITADQVVTFRAPIQISITPDGGDDHFCTGENVGFSVSVSGGTGTYQVPPATMVPATVTWTNTLEDGSGHFTTSDLILGSTELVRINITDSNVAGITGGCPSGDFDFNSGGGIFTIHQNITTNPLQRNP